MYHGGLASVISSLLLRYVDQYGADARREDDATTCGTTLHGFGRCLSRPERPMEINVQHGSELILGVVLGWEMLGDACIGDDNVQRTKLFGRLLDGSVDGRAVCHVTSVGLDSAARVGSSEG